MDPGASAEPFVGRDRELDALDAALREARAGRARMLAIIGDAGIGKTRTVEEFVRRLDLPPGRVLWGRCPEQPGAPTYWPWIRAIRDWAEAHDPATVRAGLADDARVVAEIVPTIRERLGDLAPVAADDRDPQARFRLFDGVASFLQRIAAAEPLVVVIEDLHWADEASLLLLAFVAREAHAGQLLLIVTYRERESRRWPRAFADVARLGRRIILRGLDRPALETLVSRAMGGPPAPALLSRLEDVTEGNPFFLDEILRGLDAVASATPAPVDGVRVTLPESLREAMHRRVDPLADDTRSLLATAAVIGREFDVALLQTATGLSSSVVLQQLTAAATAGVVEEHDRVGAFRFTHALIREMLYADLLPVTRAGLHHRVATALEAAHGSEDAALGALAFHYFHAAPLGVAAKAFEFSMRAAGVASRLLAHGDAVAHYERALAALSFEPPDDRRRGVVSQALGLAAWLAGHNPKARDHYRIAARCARAVDDRHGLVFAAMGHARASPPSGAPDPASVALLEEALAAVPDEDGAARAMLLAMLGRALYFSPELARCHAVTAEAVAMARRVGDRTALTVALLCRQLALLGPGAVEERVALSDESLRLAGEPGVDLGTHESRLTRTLCLLERGEIGAATREVDVMRASADRARLPERQWHATVHRAALAHLAGDFESAASFAAQAIAVRRDASDPAVSHVFVVQTFLCRCETGNLEGLEESVRALARDYPAVPAWRCVLALLLAETGRPDEARVILDAIAPDDFAALRRDFLFPAGLAWLARLVALLRDRERARVVERLLAPFADRNVVISLYSPGCLGSAETYLGLVSTTLGELDAAARRFEAALAMNTRMGARPLVARTQQAYARMLLARDRTGDRARAAALLAAARETAQACGMTTLLAELADERAPAAPAAAGPGSGEPVVEATLRREPDCWTVSYGGDTFQLKDTKGLVFLHALLAHPGRDVHVLDLATGHAGGDASPGRPAGDGSELLDGAARVAYKERLDDLRDELDEAERFNDVERATRARREIEFLSEELARAVGLGGRDRRAASAAERARVNVTRTIAAVLKKIADASPALGQHLAATVRTGYFCSYAPDPRMPTVWRL